MGSFDRVILFMLINVSRAAEPKGAFQVDLSLNFLSDFMSEKVFPMTFLSWVPFPLPRSLSLSKNCVVESFFWKVSSSHRSSPADCQTEF